MTALGVVIVTYNAADVICGCLHSLLASSQDMQVVVVDNASTDGTVERVKALQRGETTAPAGPFEIPRLEGPTSAPRLRVLEAPENGGFAAGVNLGLAHLLAHSGADRFWILNPDTLVPPGTAEAIASEPLDFDLMGTRVLYADPPHLIQIDAGTINWWTGVTGNLNLGTKATASLPETSKIDFISGASMVASRSFVERAGPMPEHYFLYYEEVEWAQLTERPLRLCEGAMVYHLAGSAIGSPSLTTPASPLSAYFKHRSRMLFLKRFNPRALPIGYIYGLAKALQHLTRRQWQQARAILLALHGQALSADIAPNTGHQPIQRRA